MDIIYYIDIHLYRYSFIYSLYIHNRLTVYETSEYSVFNTNIIVHVSKFTEK